MPSKPINWNTATGRMSSSPVYIRDMEKCRRLEIRLQNLLSDIVDGIDVRPIFSKNKYEVIVNPKIRYTHEISGSAVYMHINDAAANAAANIRQHTQKILDQCNVILNQPVKPKLITVEFSL